jgi:DNA ligase-associated metallophosphoesterase
MQFPAPIIAPIAGSGEMAAADRAAGWYKIAMDPIHMQSLRFGRAELALDLSGALWWSRERLLAVADLHLEKGSSYAATAGRLIPPYDSAQTLRRLAAVIARLRPATVICLGDSFHDKRAALRLAPADAALLRNLVAARRWIWIGGNHDPAPPPEFGGEVADEIAMGELTFRHQADRAGVNEISGHFHPVASVATRGRGLRRRCFTVGHQRLIMPAFGAYAGGLNVLDPAVSVLFPMGFEVHVMGEGKLHRLAMNQLRPDASSFPLPIRRIAVE